MNLIRLHYSSLQVLIFFPIEHWPVWISLECVSVVGYCAMFKGA